MAELGRLAAQRVRQLRLNRGWSARELAEACARQGASSLTRSTIAKIESGGRRLTVGEAAILAQVLDVTPNDLVEISDPHIFPGYVFLSYAEEDKEAARRITAALREYGIEYYDWLEQRDDQFISTIERALSQAGAFIAVMSPHFLASPWCRMERELAIQRELDLRASDPDFVFIHVLQVADTPYADSGFLRRYDWHNLTDPESRAERLAGLVGILRSATRPLEGISLLSETAQSRGRSFQQFRDRRAELDRVSYCLTSEAGPHFWLLTAPPGLGKTWFLDRLSVEITTQEDWVSRLVDLDEHPPELRTDVNALIAQLFGPLIADRDVTPRAIAQGISRTRKSHLCLLDSAELLTAETASALRTQLSSIYRLVQEAGNSDIRLALVVATRREQDWRGVAPDPRLSVLSLTEFNVDIVRHALRDAADTMTRTFDAAYLRRNAERVHSLSEGLPALLVPCLQWIWLEEWLELERLETEELFAEIAHPYIQDWLLARDSLYPEADERPHRSQQGQPSEQFRAVERAFRLLVPYRLFTQTHVRHHVMSDPGFADALGGLDWSVEDVWRVINRSALLRRPLDEPWQEIYPAIRRLLFRYFYPSDYARALAHGEARKFVEVWSESQVGKEQAMGLLESLWHEACALRLSRATDMEARLSDLARGLSLTLRDSSAYAATELRAFAADRMRDDDEFQQVIGNIDGLLNRLASIIQEP